MAPLLPVSPDHPLHYVWGGQCEGWRLLDSETLSVVEERMPPGTHEILHCHTISRQIFYILSGKAVFEINGETRHLSKHNSILVAPMELHRINNMHHEDLFFLVISQPKVADDRFEIIPFEEGLEEHIKILNEEWLTKYFVVEPYDSKLLDAPVEEIIEKGGLIFYLRHQNRIIGTASLLNNGNNTYELGKMAVTENSQGKGAGTILLNHCIHAARNKKVKALILYSNRKLGPALHLYRKYGFVEVPMEKTQYSRADIKMELLFEN